MLKISAALRVQHQYNNLLDVDTICSLSDRPGAALLSQRRKPHPVWYLVQRCSFNGHEKGSSTPASLRWQSNSLIFTKSKAAHFKEAGLVENHTQSEQQRKRRGNSLTALTFLLRSGRFNRKLRWMDDVFRVCLGLVFSYLQHAEQSVPLSALSLARDGIRVVKRMMGKLFPATLHLGLLLMGHVLFM